MNDLLTVILAFAVIIVAGLFVTLPFAFTGWIVLLVISIFTTVHITYWTCVVVGVVVAIIAGILG